MAEDHGIGVARRDHLVKRPCALAKLGLNSVRICRQDNDASFIDERNRILFARSCPGERPCTLRDALGHRAMLPCVQRALRERKGTPDEGIHQIVPAARARRDAPVERDSCVVHRTDVEEPVAATRPRRRANEVNRGLAFEDSVEGHRCWKVVEGGEETSGARDRPEEGAARDEPRVVRSSAPKGNERPHRRRLIYTLADPPVESTTFRAKALGSTATVLSGPVRSDGYGFAELGTKGGRPIPCLREVVTLLPPPDKTTIVLDDEPMLLDEGSVVVEDDIAVASVVEPALRSEADVIEVGDEVVFDV